MAAAVAAIVVVELIDLEIMGMLPVVALIEIILQLRANVSDCHIMKYQGFEWSRRLLLLALHILIHIIILHDRGTTITIIIILLQQEGGIIIIHEVDQKMAVVVSV